MSTHHPTFDTLSSYSAGDLRSGARMVVSLHLRACPACRAEVEHMQSVAGAILADGPSVELADDALDRALAAIETTPRNTDLGVDEVLRRGSWIPLGPGLAIKPLSRFADPGERLLLIRAAAGQALPEHGHRGAERLVVLSGAVDDDQDRYKPGDLCERGPEDRHQPVAARGETCVCLSAYDGALKLAGPARWLQPLMGL
jgi:putative transcriptional regulator